MKVAEWELWLPTLSFAGAIDKGGATNSVAGKEEPGWTGHPAFVDSHASKARRGTPGALPCRSGGAFGQEALHELGVEVAGAEIIVLEDALMQ